jgi:hypothetical protein
MSGDALHAPNTPHRIRALLRVQRVWAKKRSWNFLAAAAQYVQTPADAAEIVVEANSVHAQHAREYDPIP